MTVPGYRLGELLHDGAWSVHRGNAADGSRVIITIVSPPPPPDVVAALALPFEGIPPLRALVPIADAQRDALAIVEAEPEGWRVGDLRWPMPIDEVVRVGLDLSRVLEQMHAAGVVHGSLRPQTVWIDGDSKLTGTTPRPERAGVHALAATPSRGTVSPFHADIFFPDVLARGEPASISSDVAQLGMLLYRMATHRSPFADESIMQQLVKAMHGDAAPWPAGDAKSRAVEQLARDAFDPARAATRSLAALRDGLARLHA